MTETAGWAVLPTSARDIESKGKEMKKMEKLLGGNGQLDRWSTLEFSYSTVIRVVKRQRCWSRLAQFLRSTEVIDTAGAHERTCTNTIHSSTVSGQSAYGVHTPHPVQHGETFGYNASAAPPRLS